MRDGAVLDELNSRLAEASRDAEARPNITGPRIVTLKVAITTRVEKITSLESRVIPTIEAFVPPVKLPPDCAFSAQGVFSRDPKRPGILVNTEMLPEQAELFDQ
jgi:hypothetical protein